MSKSNLLNAPLNIEEIDGSPSLWPWKLLVNNSTLTDNGDGTATLLMSLGALDITGYGANEVLFINSGGTAVDSDSDFIWDGANLGINNASPNVALDVIGDVEVSGVGTIADTWTWTGGGIIVNDTIPIALGTDSDAILQHNATLIELDLTPQTIDFNIKTTGNTNTLYINEDIGNVGIRTATPSNLFSLAVDNFDIETGLHTATSAGIFRNFHTATGANNISGDLQGLNNSAFLSGSNAADRIGSVIGQNNAIGIIAETGNYDDIINMTCVVNKFTANMDGSYTHNIDDIYGIWNRPINPVNSSTVNVDNMYQLLIEDWAGEFGAGFHSKWTVTTSASIWLKTQTIGDTNNYGIVLDGDDDGSGGADIVFGASQDVRIYYDSVNNSGVFADGDWLMDSTNQLQFGDSGTYIAQLTDGHLDLVADISIDMNGVVEFESGIIVESDNKVNDYSMTTADYEVFIDGSSNTVDITMLASPVNGRRQEFACIDNTNKVQLLRNGKLIFGNASDIEMIKGETFILTYDSTSGGWW